MCWCNSLELRDREGLTRRGFACVGLGAAAGFLAGAVLPAKAQSPSVAPITRTIIERRAIPGSDQEMQMFLISFQPGAASPLHHHPVAGLTYILEGEAESAYGDDVPKVYRAGDTLQDLPDVPHTVFRNPNKKSGLRFLAFANLRHDQPYVITP